MEGEQEKKEEEGKQIVEQERKDGHPSPNFLGRGRERGPDALYKSGSLKDIPNTCLSGKEGEGKREEYHIFRDPSKGFISSSLRGGGKGLLPIVCPIKGWVYFNGRGGRGGEERLAPSPTRKKDL